MEVLERGPLLEQLDDLLGEAALGHGRLVVVRREAGIGKTTLVREFTAGRSRRVLWGMCDPVVPPRPLAPVFDIAAGLHGESSELPAALADSDRNRIVAACLGLLRAEGGPWIGRRSIICATGIPQWTPRNWHAMLRRQATPKRSSSSHRRRRGTRPRWGRTAQLRPTTPVR